MTKFDYCERLDASFFAEPFNAFSNIFFIVAAYMSYVNMTKQRLDDKTRYSVNLLQLLLVLIGIGSFLWHTLASAWAELADVIPITLFMYVYLFSFVYLVLNKGLWISLSVLIFFSIVNYSAGRFLDASLLNGSIMYIPTFIALLILQILARKKEGISLFNASVSLFAISLVFRSIDFIVCESFHLGTHFLWHICNAIMLYMLIVFLIKK